MVLLAKQVTVTGISTFYRTEPLGRCEQPVFLNGVVAARSRLSARALKFEVLRPIEEALGRAAAERGYPSSDNQSRDRQGMDPVNDFAKAVRERLGL